MGIALSAGANVNAVAFNVLQGNSTGIWIQSNANTISSNLAEYNTNVGILLNQVSSNSLVANTFLRNLNAGIWLDQASGNVIRSNTIALNANWGMFHANGSAGQSIFDNYLSNTNNAGFSASGSNAWSIALTPGVNSVGGAYLGGNYWATPAGSGFSQTAPDADRNGIADATLPLATGNLDSLPLHAKARVRPSASFDIDNRSDLLWRKAATGENAIWFLNGTSVNGQFIAPVIDPGWSIVGRDSFDGDGRADILWRHTDGRNALWFMDGVAAKP
jgi:parallel beta-helix repeat protein